MIKKHYAQFDLGYIVRHSVLGYRAVVVDVDPNFQGNESWYEEADQPPKDEPWYHLLIDGMEYWAYAAESSLESDDLGGPIEHPELEYYFDTFNDGMYGLPLKMLS